MMGIFIFVEFFVLYIEIIATIYGGYVTVSEKLKNKGLVWIQMRADTNDMNKNVITTQQKKGYCQLLKYLFDIATIGIVSQKNYIFETDKNHSIQNK